MKKKRIAIIISIILVLVAVTISGSYALFYRENTAQMKESYSTGLLSIVAKSKTENINLDNALPITDEEGLLTNPYVFTIENRGNLDYQFDVRLLSTSDNPIEAQYIKLQIDDGEVTTLSNLTDSKIKSDIVLKAKESIDISIRIWLDWNTPNSQIGKVFNSKIITEGKAIYTENNLERDVNNYVEPDAPALAEGMIPVKYDDTNDVWVKAEYTNHGHDWYDYNPRQNRWANAVMVTSNTRDNYMNADVNTPVLENDILAYYVWIPRYRYKLFNVNSEIIDPLSIEIEFQEKEDTIYNGTQNGEWLTHPAFWWDNNSNGIREEGEELSGIWVGKFETGGTETKPLIKPNIKSKTYLPISYFFNMSRKFNSTLYLTENGINEIDAHMIKNIDWGAAAYLSHSIYGTNKEICINNSSSLYTGRSGGIVGGSISAISYGNYTYNDYIINNGTITNNKVMGKGMCASTTGNIYGIYDMSGGGTDYVMGVMKNTYGTVMYQGGSEFDEISIPLPKYYDLYDYGTDSTNLSRRILGDATGETRNWHSDYASFVKETHPWFIRGGSYSNGIASGIFRTGISTGNRLDSLSSRSILVLP